jgi:prevent-host-death family protein
MSNTISAVDARDHFAEVVNRIAYGKERLILTRHGKELVAMVPVEDLELLERLEDAIDLEEARKALEEVEQEGTTPWSEIKQRLGL